MISNAEFFYQQQQQQMMHAAIAAQEDEEFAFLLLASPGSAAVGARCEIASNPDQRPERSADVRWP